MANTVVTVAAPTIHLVVGIANPRPSECRSSVPAAGARNGVSNHTQWFTTRPLIIPPIHARSHSI